VELANSTADKVALSLKGFLAEHRAVKVELVRRILATIGSGERDLTHQHYERILQLAEQDVGGRKVELPSGFIVRREYENLVFTRPQKSSRCDGQIGQSASLEVPGQTKFGRYLIESTVVEAGKSEFERFKAGKSSLVEWFDFDKIRLPLIARFREAGDRFRPLGLAGAKKVGKFLTTARVAQHIRREALIVADSEKIIWVWPIRISERAKITGETQKILELRITGPKLER
jgi:tRNA(Ile)-lysidine synthase